MQSEPDRLLQLEVSDIRAEAHDVILVELRSRDGGTLPQFDPGAHLEINLPNGLIRHYSLSNDNSERDRYVIGVGRAAVSRGGSDYIHQSLKCGMALSVVGPRNNFSLDPSADSYLFIAGGIGITPIMAMVRWCVAHSREWRLIYAARSRQRAAFYEDLQALDITPIKFHFDDEDGGPLDVAKILSGLDGNTKTYCCGPATMMQAIADATSHMVDGQVHFEHFTAPDAAPAKEEDQSEFRVELKQSGTSYDVPGNKSILEVLEENGHDLPFSCREGLCRTCEVTVCEGEPDHRDYVLSSEEQDAGKTMTICVSRAKSKTLVLDL